jgi:hypothetical protein
MSGCPDCPKRARWWLWVVPAIVLAVGARELLVRRTALVSRQEL